MEMEMGTVYAQLLTLQCNFFVKWKKTKKQTNLRAHLFDSVLRPIVWFTWEGLPGTTRRLWSGYYLNLSSNSSNLWEPVIYSASCLATHRAAFREWSGAA